MKVNLEMKHCYSDDNVNKKEGLKPGDKDYKYMFLNNHAPNPLLVKAIQDQQKIIESLEKRIIQLENRK